MNILLAICFVVLTLFALPDMKINPTVPKFLSALYIGGMVLLDLSILAMLVCMWLVEHGRL